MIKVNKNQILDILNAALKTGGDYSELYFEDTTSTTLMFENSKVSKTNINNICGCGIRILKDDKCVYGYSNNITYTNLLNLANSLKDCFEGSQTHFVEDVVEVKEKMKNKAKNPYDKVGLDEQVLLIKKASDVALAYDQRIKKVDVRYSFSNQKVTIYNSDGKIVKDKRVRGRCFFTTYAFEGSNMQIGTRGPGAQRGFEFFKDQISLNEVALDSAKSAITMLSATDCPSGEMCVVIENGFGGVIFHEACGHGLEASLVSKNLSVFSDKKGQKVASSIVNAFDDGTIDGGWGSSNYDDEGNKTQRTQLIKNGYLINYLVDNFNGRAMNELGNGACRRQSYKYVPTSRMSNTFIGNGTSTRDEIIKNTKYGLYAKVLGGGSVNPTTGDFNFAVREGYMIEDGKITTPVKGATLIGNGAKVLFNIDMIANNLRLEQGMCGASSGSIPADVGQPTIRVKSILVGGTKGKVKA
ncbi:MAG: TldD/PmbA family protein [Erysipelotrichaceae bacterium]|nr:TldD/PmbA family protein [Erysipelotrichaceae bacterium]